ncbi:DofA protein [Corallococcus macrosporus]|uniref:DofA protein n=1 Tax=Corallococcus macrosporus TaxID=35 RepID=A0ABS3DKD8_9BACT|nr:DofA protein [Corallococcus macrosporus]MBN8231829.1 DofA protein [Corallococcus macrosporus]
MALPVYKTDVIDKVFFLRWDAPPTPDEIQAVFQKMQTAYQQHQQQQLVLVTSAGAKSAVPNSEQRRHLSNMLSDARALFSEIHVVIEGNELQHNLQRVIVSGMLIVTRTYDDQFIRVHKNADGAAGFIARRLGVDGTQVVNEARSRGVVM